MLYRFYIPYRVSLIHTHPQKPHNIMRISALYKTCIVRICEECVFWGVFDAQPRFSLRLSFILHPKQPIISVNSVGSVCKYTLKYIRLTPEKDIQIGEKSIRFFIIQVIKFFSKTCYHLCKINDGAFFCVCKRRLRIAHRFGADFVKLFTSQI